MVDRSEHMSNMTSESHTGPVLTNAELYRTAKSGSGKYCRTLETLSEKKKEHVNLHLHTPRMQDPCRRHCRYGVKHYNNQSINQSISQSIHSDESSGVDL